MGAVEIETGNFIVGQGWNVQVGTTLAAPPLGWPVRLLAPVFIPVLPSLFPPSSVRHSLLLQNDTVPEVSP